MPIAVLRVSFGSPELAYSRVSMRRAIGTGGPAFIAVIGRGQAVDIVARVLGHGRVHDEVHDLAQSAEGSRQGLLPGRRGRSTGRIADERITVVPARILPGPVAGARGLALLGVALHPADGGVLADEADEPPTPVVPRLERV